ncbi:MAG TPA: NADPH:quinone reductase [Nitrospiraceae bacterium]|jgi:NADPH:quinone reductase-like Zn-dependent oxidoreductase|nr:NADPH:quinone reductase [Nitrospiraceae bacterium]
MKAVRIHQYGSPEVLVYEDVVRPRPGSGNVLVEVHAAGVNPIDWKVREGHAKGWLNHALPLILGWDVSGVIVELGNTANGFKKGDEVYGKLDVMHDGAYAEYTTTATENITLKPKTVDHVHAAAVPIAALTAWQSLFDLANLSTGQTILIHAAAGGVGHFAVQFAKWKGARVIGTASARNTKFVKKLGAEEVIDYTVRKFEDEVRGVDCVLDTQGGEVLSRSLRVLKKGGIVVSTLEEPRAEDLTRYGVRATHVIAKSDSRQLKEIAALIDTGHVKPAVEIVLPLAEARKAHELSQSGHTHGKIVLKVKP